MSNLLRFLPRDRFEPILCVWRAVFEYPVPADVPVHVLNKYHTWDVIPAAQCLVRLIDDLRPDLVFSQLPYVSLVTGIALKLTRNRPRWIARLAGNPLVDIAFPLVNLSRRVYREVDHLVGCSLGVTAALKSHLRIDDERASTLYNVIDINEIQTRALEPPTVRKTPGTYTIVHAGRFTAQKNQALLLRAFAQLRDLPAELWMLGRGQLGDKLQTLAKRLKIDQRVRWLGFQSNPFPLYREADCFALSSDHEGLPNVVVESLLAGAPVVSTDCPFGPRELLLPDRVGLLVRVGDERGLAEGLRTLAAEPVRMALKQRLPSDYGKRFAAATVVPQYCELFERIVDA